MAAVSTSLDEQARSIFDDIGYTVSRTDDGLLAAQKWREVGVTIYDGEATIPDSGDLHCFVTRESNTTELCDRLEAREVPYDWAVLAVDEDGGYEVIRQ